MFFLFVFFVGLIALVFGVGLLIWSYRNQGKCVGFGRVFGYIVTIGAVLGLVCLTWCGTVYKKGGGGYHKFMKPAAVQMHHNVTQHDWIRNQQ